MKINKQILVAVLGLGIAVSAQADSWSNSGPSGLHTYAAGTSGTSVFTFDNTGGGAFSITATPPTAIGTPGGFFSSITINSYTLASGSDFSVTVGWTIASGATGVDTLTADITPVNTTDNTDVEPQSASERFAVAAAPEPAQTVAGAMLLGCGGLVFAGRRLFTKKSA